MFGDSHEDRIIPATPRRLAEARRQGYAPRSRELTSAIVALASAVALWFTLPTIWQAAQELFRATWLHPVVRPSDAVTASVPAVAQLAWSVGGVLIAAVVAAIVAGLLQSGFRPSWRWPQPRWLHISLFTGWQRFRSGGGFAAILFVLKCAAVCVLLALLIPALLGYAAMPDLKGIAGFATQIVGYGVWFTVALLLLALPDVWARRRAFRHGLRMTASELREEQRDLKKPRRQRTRMSQTVSNIVDETETSSASGPQAIFDERFRSHDRTSVGSATPV